LSFSNDARVWQHEQELKALDYEASTFTSLCPAVAMDFYSHFVVENFFKNARQPDPFKAHEIYETRQRAEGFLAKIRERGGFSFEYLAL
jgi:hypothetical protein